MDKLQKLRDYVIACTSLKLQPEDVVSWVRAGKITSHVAAKNSGANQNFVVTYDLHLLVSDFSAPAHELFYLVLRWAHEHIDGIGSDSVTFDSDALDSERCDVEIVIRGVRDTVKVRETDQGVELHTCAGRQDVDPIVLAPLPSVGN